jgi:hypothetical protein
MRNKKGQFQRIPEGQKSQKMLEVEKRLGRTLEEDFGENYTNKHWGQKKLANRWGVKKEQIFSENMRGGRRCWVDMLSLQVRRLGNGKEVATSKKERNHCELCMVEDVALDRAHWVSATSGGSRRRYNILAVCPNCHRKMDSDDASTIKKAREVILLREATKVIESRIPEDQKRHLLVGICEAIISRVPLSNELEVDLLRAL